MNANRNICCIIDKKTGVPACPLQDVEIEAVVGSTIAEVTLKQSYINTGKAGIEALYTFPLPHNAQVTGFAGKIGENVVRGEFRENEEAFKEYDQAVRRGDSAFLLESHRPDIFQISLGNITPGEKASITISYLEDVTIVNNELRWALPTVVAPRYIPGSVTGRKTGMGTMMPTDIVPDADNITPPVGETTYTLKIRAVLSGLKGIKKVSSPSHPVEILFNGNDVIVSLSRETELLDSDFILSILLDADGESSYETAVVGGTVAFGTADCGNKVSDLSGHDSEVYGSVRLKIEMEDSLEKQNPVEYIFMIDVSGSMAGEKLDQAKRALAISLRNLLEGDCFNMVAFESNFNCFSKEAVSYSQQSLERADQWISALTHMGGTEIYEPLRFVLEDTVLNRDLERVVLLFTDGQIGNENEVIALVKKHRCSLQFFPFGIDTAVNKYFIDSLATAGNGLPEYVYPGERIEDKVIRQFSRIHQLYLANPIVSGKDGTELETVPPIPARIYGSEGYSFMVRSEQADLLEEIHIRGTIEGKDTEIVLQSNTKGDARLLGLRWAKGKIKQLEEQSEGGNQRRNLLIKQEIVELSIKYSLLSTLTSLVAVYKRRVKETGMPETIVVPVAKPRGWELFDEPSKVMYNMAPMRVTESSMRSYSSMDTADDLDIPRFLRKKTNSRSGSIKPVQRNGVLKENTPPAAKEIIRRAAQSQNANGTFGSGNDVYRKTSFYIIGMLLREEEWRPYRIQLIKAGGALIHTGSGDLLRSSDLQQSSAEDLLLKAVAFSLLLEMRLMQAGELRTMTDDAVRRLSAPDKAAFEAFKSGNQQLFSDRIGFSYIGSINKKELSSWLLENTIE